MTLKTLHTQIKQEARVQGTNELDGYVYDVIREVHQEHTERQRYSELLILSAPITLTDGIGNYDLPADFQHLKELRFSYSGAYANGVPNWRPLDLRGDFHPKRRTSGLPRFYERADNKIWLYPYSDIKLSMAMEIDYYRLAPLTEEDEEMPVRKLVPVVKRDAIARVHIYYKEMQSAAAFNSLSKSAIIGSQSRTETGH
jgi:hypothetical protein